MTEDLPVTGAGREIVLKIAEAAHAIGWQAGVGGMETAGAIVSYLANHQDQIEPFLAGDVSPIDWPDFVGDGCLTWQAKDGSIVHPSYLREASPTPARDQANG